MFVRGLEASGKEFLALGRTLDISSTGAFIASPRPLNINDLVQLSIPAPPPSSSGLLAPEMPPIQARVLRQRSTGDFHLIGVAFLRPLE